MVIFSRFFIWNTNKRNIRLHCPKPRETSRAIFFSIRKFFKTNFFKSHEKNILYKIFLLTKKYLRIFFTCMSAQNQLLRENVMFPSFLRLEWVCRGVLARRCTGANTGALFQKWRPSVMKMRPCDGMQLQYLSLNLGINFYELRKINEENCITIAW